MIQVFSGGNYTTALSDTATQYCNILGNASNAWTTSSSNCRIIFGSAGTLRNFKVVLSGAPGAGTSWIFTIQAGTTVSSDTAMSITISDSATSGTYTSDLSVTLAHALQIKVTRTGAPSLVKAIWSVEFEPTTSKRFIVGGNCFNSTPSNTTTNYLPFVGSNPVNSTESNVSIISPINATIKSFFVRTSSAHGTGKSVTYSIMKNGSSEASSNVVLSDSKISANVVGLTIDMAPGDTFSIQYVPSGTPTMARIYFGVSIEPDKDGESFIAGGSSSAITTDTESFFFFDNVSSTAIKSTESDAYILGGIRTYYLYNAYARLGTSPGTDNSRRFTMRKNGADGGNTISISGAGTTGQDTSNVDTISDGDKINFSLDGTGTAASSTYKFSLVQSITSPAVASGASSLMLMGMGA